MAGVFQGSLYQFPIFGPDQTMHIYANFEGQYFFPEKIVHEVWLGYENNDLGGGFKDSLFIFILTPHFWGNYPI